MLRLTPRTSRRRTSGCHGWMPYLVPRVGKSSHVTRNSCERDGQQPCNAEKVVLQAHHFLASKPFRIALSRCCPVPPARPGRDDGHGALPRRPGRNSVRRPGTSPTIAPMSRQAEGRSAPWTPSGSGRTEQRGRSLGRQPTCSGSTGRCPTGSYSLRHFGTRCSRPTHHSGSSRLAWGGTASSWADGDDR